VDLFKKFIWDNERIRRLGTSYRASDDFLHDCFTNVLRAGHSFDPEQEMEDWVESVAMWTALERQRTRDMEAQAASGKFRLCAGSESDEAANRTRLPSYVPPRNGDQDTLGARIQSVIGQNSYTILTKRALENATWEQVAAAAGKPLSTVGPALVRSVDRLVRFFGAPPPLNADLETIFSRIGGQDATPKSGSAPKATGRLRSMQLDSAFYPVTPELRKIGLGIPSDVRTAVLLDAARSSTPPADHLRDHLAQCNYCAELLRAMILLQQALQNSASTDFLLCPGGFTLLNTPGQDYEPLEQHLAACGACRTERDRMLTGESETPAPVQPDAAPAAGLAGMSQRTKLIAAGALAAVLLLAAIFFFSGKSSPPADPVVASSGGVSTEPIQIPDIPVVKVDPRFKDLAQPISLDDKNWLASVRPENQYDFSQAKLDFQKGMLARALPSASAMGANDPGAQMLYAVGLYQQNALSEGYQAMLKSELMTPRNSFRCWATLQCALIVGDLKVVEREAGHLASDPEYGARAKALLAQAKARS